VPKRATSLAGAILGLLLAGMLPAAGQVSAGAAGANAPVATDARVGGDAKQTRFVVDLSRKVDIRAFTLADPYRVVIDLPQVSFQLPPKAGERGRGLVKAFRFGLVMPGGSRIVLDVTGPVRVEKAFVLDPSDGQPARLVLDLVGVDREAFLRAAAVDNRVAPEGAKKSEPQSNSGRDQRPIIVLDPGHGGIDTGTRAPSGEAEKEVVLDIALMLRDKLEKSGKYRVVMTRTDDTFVPLDDRVRVARSQSAALFVSIHADALPRREGDAQGATIYTLSDKASDAEAERLAEAENKADAIGGVNLTEEPVVADILIDLAQRETRTFSNRFARMLMGEMKSTVRMHKHPLKSAGFRVLKAPDVPSVLVELGYVSNKGDLEHLMSENWRAKTVGSMAQAIDAFFAKRLATAGAAK